MKSAVKSYRYFGDHLYEATKCEGCGEWVQAQSVKDGLCSICQYDPEIMALDAETEEMIDGLKEGGGPHG